ncbi:MAG: hypothetical protein QF464_05705, partial [Myxococcota bacterium]|nr:hypothetical protein [Myxococcota bacterium]
MVARTDSAGRTVFAAIVMYALASVGGCNGQEADACHGSLESAVTVPPDSHVYADTSLPGIEGWVIDPTPLARGEHVVQRLWRDPATCEFVGGWYAWAPPPPGATAPPPAQEGPASGTSTIRALVVLGDDPGAFEDAEAWFEALSTLGARHQHLFAPDRRTFLDAVATTCSSASEDDTVLLAATGRGSPAGDGSLILGAEAVSHPSLFAHLAEACATAGLVITIMDTSYVPRVDDWWPANAPPLIAWRGSDAVTPDAPRRHIAGGGLLTGALAAHLTAVASQDCLGAGDATPWDLARLFGDTESVRVRMKQLRWAEVGAPRLAAETRPGLHRRQEIAAWASSGLPIDVLHTVGEIPSHTGCAQDADCALRADDCALGVCRRLACVTGRCIAEIAEGDGCDDGSVCTSDDRCDALGLCRGHQVSCEDHIPCTIDTCLHDEGCVHTPQAGADCDDGDLCTLVDRCQPSGLCAGTPIDCSDDNPCTLDWCDPVSGCVFEVNHASCDDGNACTSPDYCEDGLCRGAPMACHDADPCTADACDLDTGCVNPPLPEGALCDDEDG